MNSSSSGEENSQPGGRGLLVARLAATAAEVTCGDDQLKLPLGVDPEGTVAKELAKP